MKNRKKKYLHERKVAKRLATLALVATTLAQPTFGLVNVTSVYAQEAAAQSSTPAANRDMKRTPIPFKTIYEEDPTLEAGKKRVRVKGVEGFKEVITSTTPDVAAVAGKGSGVLNFTTKAASTTNTTAKPRKILLALDYSGSFAGEQGQKYVATLAKRVVNSMNPGDEMSIIGTATTWDWLQDEWTSNVIPITSDKAKLLDFIDHPKNYKYRGEKVTDLNTFMRSIGYNGEYKDFTVVSLIDDTGFTINEGVDKSFQYPILKDFVSKGGTVLGYIPAVGDTKNGDLDITENTMKKIGAKHIEYIDYKDGQNAEATADKLVNSLTKQTVFTVKGENQTAKITIGGNGTKVLTAKLKGAATKDLPIKDGKVDVSEKLADGSYTVEFTAEGNGTVAAKVAVDGKEVDTKTVALKETAGKKGTSTSDEKITPAVDEVIQVGTKPVTKESATPFKTIYEEDKELEAGKKVTKQEGSAGAGSIVTTYTLNKQTGEVTPKEEKSDKPAQDQIIKVGTKPTVVETKIPYKTIEEKDPTLPEGERKVKVKGVEGLKTVTTTYTLNTKTGEVTPKEDAKEKPKVDEVILVGTKKKAAQVKLRFIDKKSNKSLKDDEIVTNDQSKFGDEFSLKPEKELKVGNDLYRLVEIKLTDSKEDSKIEGLSEDKKSLTSKVTESEQSYDAVYERVVYTSYVDENGKELDKTVEGAQDKKEIKGYDFVKTEKSDNGDVKHIYKAKPVKGKTPSKFADTNEKSGVMYTILGLIGAAALAETIRRKKQSK